MAGPTIKSITFDKESYEPGTKVTVTVSYTRGPLASDPFTLKVVERVGTQAATKQAVFTELTPPAKFTLSDTGGHVWTKVSDNGTEAVFTVTLAAKPPPPTTPPPTTPPPTTPPATTPPAGTPQPISNPTFSSSTDDATWPSAGTTNGFRVNNDIWSPVSGGKQTVFADSYHDWGATANCPSRTTGAVMSYPDVELCIPGSLTTTSKPIGDITACVSSWTHGIPKNIGTTPETNFQLEAGYDIFINGNTLKELMVWTDNRTRQYLYLGEAFTITVTGVTYRGYSSDTKTSSSWYVALVRYDGTTPVWSTSGTVNLHGIFQALIANGWLTASEVISFIQYGFEVTTTRGKTVTLRVYNYSCSITGVTPLSVADEPARQKRDEARARNRARTR